MGRCDGAVTAVLRSSLFPSGRGKGVEVVVDDDEEGNDQYWGEGVVGGHGDGLMVVVGWG